MQQLLRNFILRQKEKRRKRKVKVFNLKNAESALILYDASTVEEEKIIRNFARFLKEEGLKVDSIGYYKKRDKKDQLPKGELGYRYFDKRSTNWLGFPIFKELNAYQDRQYHLLFDFNFEQNFFLKSISLLSLACFKVGRAGDYQDQACDLTLATESEDLTYLLQQIEVYLKMINK